MQGWCQIRDILKLENTSKVAENFNQETSIREQITEKEIFWDKKSKKKSQTMVLFENLVLNRAEKKIIAITDLAFRQKSVYRWAVWSGELLS